MILALSHRRLCGPQTLTHHATRLLTSLTAWCHSYCAPGQTSRGDNIAKAVRCITAWRRAAVFNPGITPPRAISGSVYAALWAQTHLRDHNAWFRRRCRARRWAPGHGLEAALLRASVGYTTAHHVLRFLVNGLPGGQKWRPTRHRRPRTCDRCGSPARISCLGPSTGQLPAALPMGQSSSPAAPASRAGPAGPRHLVHMGALPALRAWGSRSGAPRILVPSCR